MSKYIKEVFDVTTFDHAKHVVLTMDPNDNAKFERETNFLVNAVKDIIKPEHTILDFGCGMGRVSKALIHNCVCNIIGVDISESMRIFARIYISNPSLFIDKPEHTEENSVDGALSVFVLQHTEDPAKEIKNIAKVVKPDGYFILLNEYERLVPSGVTRDNFIIWNDDKFDVFTEVEKYMTKEKEIPYLNTGKKIIIYRNNK